MTVRSNIAPYAKRRFPICFNGKLWHLKVPFLRFLPPPPHHEASGGASEYAWSKTVNILLYWSVYLLVTLVVGLEGVKLEKTYISWF